MATLRDKVCVVTGGTGALGTAICGALLRAGAFVHATYRSDRELPHFESQMHDYRERYRLHRHDITAEADVIALFHDVDTISRRLDALLTVAGGFAAGPIDATPMATFDELVSLNLRSVFLCCREAVRRMKPAGRGRIVTVAARAALDCPGGMAAYVTTKAGVLALTRSIAAECKGTGITANAIVPSVIDTPANRKAMPTADFSAWVQPAEVARVAAFLCGDDSRAVSGAAIPVYGDA